MSSSPDRDPVSCEHEAARLLPWLVVGALPESETVRVQEHLRTCPVCAADWKREQDLQAHICDEPAVEHVHQPGWQKLITRIDELEREMPSLPGSALPPVQIPASRSRLVHWLAAAVIVQTIGLALLGTLFWQRGVELHAPRFHTMSSAPSTADGAARIRVVFAPEMKVGEMRELLSSVSATVVAGPSEAGVYTLALSDERRSVNEVLHALRAVGNVSFAEPLSIAEPHQ